MSINSLYKIEECSNCGNISRWTRVTKIIKNTFMGRGAVLPHRASTNKEVEKFPKHFRKFYFWYSFQNKLSKNVQFFVKTACAWPFPSYFSTKTCMLGQFLLHVNLPLSPKIWSKLPILLELKPKQESELEITGNDVHLAN